MTCIRAGNAIICVNDWGRLHIGNRYVWVSMHPYCGPSFFWDTAMTKEYDIKGRRDPIWPAFEAWYEKQKAKKQRNERKKR